jgi:hypothetical protein
MMMSYDEPGMRRKSNDDEYSEKEDWIIKHGFGINTKTMEHKFSDKWKEWEDKENPQKFVAEMLDLKEIQLALRPKYDPAAERERERKRITEYFKRLQARIEFLNYDWFESFEQDEEGMQTLQDFERDLKSYGRNASSELEVNGPSTNLVLSKQNWVLVNETTKEKKSFSYEIEPEILYRGFYNFVKQANKDRKN